MTGYVIHDFIHTVGGAERVVECISRKVEPDFEILALGFDQEILESLQLKNAKALLQINISESLKRQLAPLIQQLVSRIKFDVPIITSTYSFAHLVSSPIQLNYCHSPMRQLWSGYHEYSRSQSLLQNLGLKLFSKRMQALDRAGAKRSPNFISSSRIVASRIKKYYGLDSLAVINPPISEKLFNFKIEQDKDYWVWCGRIIEPYKKVSALVEIFNSLNERLVIIGDGPDRKNIELRANSNITFVGYKNTEEFSEIISGAKGLIYPSHEDYGMMPMEALALGTSVIISQSSGVLELLRNNPNCAVINSLDRKSLIHAMNQVSLDSSARVDIRKSVSIYTEDQFAKSFTDVWLDIKLK